MLRVVISGLLLLATVQAPASPHGWSFVEDGWELRLAEDGPVGMARAVAADSTGLYILDGGFLAVHRYAEDGSYLGSIGREGEGPGEFYQPAKLAVHNGKVYVGSAHSSGTITCLTTEGKPLDGVRLDHPGRVQSMCFDLSGNLFVVTLNQNRHTMIEKYRPSLESPGGFAYERSFCRSFIVDEEKEQPPTYESTYALGKVAAGPDGLIYYLQGTPPEIRVFSPMGKLLRRALIRPGEIPGPPHPDFHAKVVSFSFPAIGASINVLSAGLILTTVQLSTGEGEVTTLFDCYDLACTHLGGWEKEGGPNVGCQDPEDRLYIWSRQDDLFRLVRVRLVESQN